MERDENGGSSEQPGSSHVGQALAQTVRRIMEKEMEPMVLSMVRRVIKPMVITTVQQEIVPVAEDLIHRVVKEVLQPFEERLSNEGTRNDLPEERSLQLRFLDNKVADAVTGEELKGIIDECLKLALLDSDGHIVTCGNGSSATVEILLLEDNGNDDEDNMSLENFERIQTGEKKKPHFAKSVYKSLKDGVADLNGLKLGHDKDRIKLCSCRLGARIAQNLEGTTVQEAWTSPFNVTDKRDKQYDKHPRPSLSSEVWRLDGIGRTGNRCDRLKKNNIKTVRDFLFWFHVNPEELQKQILCVGDSAWNTVVSRAQNCNIDCKRMFSHKSSTEPQTCVIYDAVGKLKGEIIDSHFVPIDNLSADEKVRARKLLRSVLEKPSAFVERYDSSLDDEDSLLKEFPYRSSSNTATTKSSLQHGGLTVSEDMSGYQTTELSYSSQSTIGANNSYDSGPSNSLGSKEMGELSNPASHAFPTDLHTSDYESYILEGLELRVENNSSPTSMPVSGKDKADADKQLLASPRMQHSTEIAGESTSGRSNASFQSARGQWFDDEPYHPGPASPDLMLHYAADVDSHNSRAHQNETCGADPPKGWKKLSRLWNQWMSRDAGRSCKKRRVD